MLLLVGLPAFAQSISCNPVMACYEPVGECDTPDGNEEAGVFEFLEDSILVYAPGDRAPMRFKIVAQSTASNTTSYFTSFKFGHSMFTLFDNGNLSMLGAVSENGGSSASVYFSCEEAPWKTS